MGPVEEGITGLVIETMEDLQKLMGSRLGTLSGPGQTHTEETTQSNLDSLFLRYATTQTTLRLKM